MFLSLPTLTAFSKWVRSNEIWSWLLTFLPGLLPVLLTPFHFTSWCPLNSACNFSLFTSVKKIIVKMCLAHSCPRKLHFFFLGLIYLSSNFAISSFLIKYFPVLELDTGSFQLGFCLQYCTEPYIYQPHTPNQSYLQVMALTFMNSWKIFFKFKLYKTIKVSMYPLHIYSLVLLLLLLFHINLLQIYIEFFREGAMSSMIFMASYLKQFLKILLLFMSFTQWGFYSWTKIRVIFNLSVIVH